MLLLLISVFLYVVFSFYEIMPKAIIKPFVFYHTYLGIPQRSFLCGIIWLGLGCLLSYCKLLDVIKEWYSIHCDSRFFIWIPLFAGLTLSIIFVHLQFLGVLSLVIIFYLINGRGWNYSLCKLLRQCSIIIYCVHYVFIYYFICQLTSNSILTFVIASGLSCFVAWIIVRLSKTRSLSFLKYLY